LRSSCNHRQRLIRHKASEISLSKSAAKSIGLLSNYAAASFTWLPPLLQSAASTQRAASGARLSAEQCSRDMNSKLAFRMKRVKR
jgi:hypothetical protein